MNGTPLNGWAYRYTDRDGDDDVVATMYEHVGDDARAASQDVEPWQPKHAVVTVRQPYLHGYSIEPGETRESSWDVVLSGVGLPEWRLAPRQVDPGGHAVSATYSDLPVAGEETLEERSFRGVISVPHKPKVLFSGQIVIETSKLRRPKPHVVIDPCLLEADDE